MQILEWSLAHGLPGVGPQHAKFLCYYTIQQSHLLSPLRLYIYSRTLPDCEPYSQQLEGRSNASIYYHEKVWYVTCHGMLFGHNKEWGPDLQTVWLHHINLVQKAASSHSPAVLESDLSKQLSLSCSAFSREAWTTHPCRIGSVCGKGAPGNFQILYILN